MKKLTRWMVVGGICLAGVGFVVHRVLKEERAVGELLLIGERGNPADKKEAPLDLPPLRPIGLERVAVLMRNVDSGRHNVRGLVVDTNGRGLDGATVKILRWGGEAYPGAEVTTSGGGKFEVSGIGVYAHAEVDGYASAWVELPASVNGSIDPLVGGVSIDGMAITMYEGGDLEGRFVWSDTGEPCKGIRYSATLGSNQKIGQTDVNVAGEEGQFLLKGVPLTGLLTLHLSLDGRPKWASVNCVRSSEKERVEDVRVPAPGTLHLDFQNSDILAAAEGEVKVIARELTTPSNLRSAGFARIVELDDLRVGALYSVSVVSRAFEPIEILTGWTMPSRNHAERIWLPSPEVRERKGFSEVDPGTVVWWSVVDDNGTELRVADLREAGFSGNAVKLLIGGDEGSTQRPCSGFRMREALNGHLAGMEFPLDLQLEVGRHKSSVQTIVNGPSTVKFTLSLEGEKRQRREVVFRGLNSLGQPARIGRVKLSDHTGGSHLRALYSRGLNKTFTFLESGTYKFVAEQGLHGSGVVKGDLVIVPGEESVEVVVRFPAGAAIRGRIGGLPQGTIGVVQVFPIGGVVDRSMHPSAIVGQSGEFSFDDLPVGRVRVVYSAVAESDPGGIHTQSSVVELRSGESKVVELQYIPGNGHDWLRVSFDGVESSLVTISRIEGGTLYHQEVLGGVKVGLSPGNYVVRVMPVMVCGIGIMPCPEHAQERTLHLGEPGKPTVLQEFHF